MFCRDALLGTSVYGTYPDTLGAPTSPSTFSINYSAYITSLSQQFLFQTGDGSVWLIATLGNITGTLAAGAYYGVQSRTAASSSYNATSCLHHFKLCFS